MQDVLFLGIAFGFLGVCAAYVRALDRIVRQAEQAEAGHAGHRGPNATPGVRGPNATGVKA